MEIIRSGAVGACYLFFNLYNFIIPVNSLLYSVAAK